MRKIIGASIFFGILIGVGVWFLPTRYTNVIREGTDHYSAHHVLYGNRVRSVSAVATSPVREVGLILVNMRRSPSLAPVQVSIVSGGKEPISLTRQLAASVDDDFIWFAHSIEAGDDFRVEVTAPAADSEAPVGVRFSREDGQLALAVKESIPLWEQLSRWAIVNPKRVEKGLFVLGGGIGIALFLLCVDRLAKWRRKESVLFICLLLVWLILYTRIPLSHAVESAFGGDAFNYILKGHAWISGEDPFAADPRKAPLYSFLTAIGLIIPLDPILWARGISILASIGAVLLVVLLLIRVGVSLPIAALSGLLLAVNRDFQFESIQGLSNPLYTFWIMAAAYLFVCRKTYLVSVAAALAAATRFEGALVAAILVPAGWFVDRFRVSRVVRSLIPLVVIAGLPLILYPFTGASGVRSVSDLRSDEGLYIGYTWGYVLPSIKALKNIFGRLWILTEHIGNPFAWFLWGIVGGLIIQSISKYVRPKSVLTLIPCIGCMFFGISVLVGFDGDMKFFIGLFSTLAGFGLGASLRAMPRISIPIVLMVFLQIVLVTAILPKNRYYLQAIPFIVLAMGVGMWALAGAGKFKKIPHIASILCMSFMTMFVWWDARASLSGQVSDYNEKSAQQTVIVRAAREVRRLPGIVGVDDGMDLVMRSYLPRQRLVFFPASLSGVDAQLGLLQEKGITHIISRTENPYFTPLISKYPERFEQIATVTTKWGEDTAAIYRVVGK